MPSLETSDWVRGKVGSVLAALARIADLARDPSTSPELARELQRSLESAFRDQLGLLLWSHDRPADGIGDDAAVPTEGGTAGLAILLDQLGLASGTDRGAELDDDEDRRPTIPPGVPHELEDPWRSPGRRQAIQRALEWLATRPDGMGENEARVLASVAVATAVGYYEDIAVLGPDLGGERAGLSAEQARPAFDRLVETSVLRVVDELRYVHRDRTPVQIVTDLRDPRRR